MIKQTTEDNVQDEEVIQTANQFQEDKRKISYFLRKFEQQLSNNNPIKEAMQALLNNKQKERKKYSKQDLEALMNKESPFKEQFKVEWVGFLNNQQFIDQLPQKGTTYQRFRLFLLHQVQGQIDAQQKQQGETQQQRRETQEHLQKQTQGNQQQQYQEPQVQPNLPQIKNFMVQEGSSMMEQNLQKFNELLNSQPQSGGQDEIVDRDSKQKELNDSSLKSYLFQLSDSLNKHAEIIRKYATQINLPVPDNFDSKDDNQYS